MTHTRTLSIYFTSAIRNCLIVSSFLVSSVCHTTAQQCSWARSMGGVGNDLMTAAVADAAGNTYTTGSFVSDSIFVGATLHNSNPGTADIFLVKYNAAGGMVWAKNLGGTGNDRAAALAIDPCGNIFLCGRFTSSTISLGDSTFSNSNINDAFLCKLNTDGTIVWASHMQFQSTTSANLPVRVTTDDTGNVICTGYFRSQMTIGGHALLAGAGGNDVFLAKYTPSGGIVWAQSTNGTGTDYVSNIAADKAGNIYLLGFSVGASQISFGPIWIDDTASENFLVKYNGAGVPQWARHFGTYGIKVAGLSTDASGNLYAGGSFGASVIAFDSITVPNFGGSDGFLTKCDPSGNVMWAKGLGGNNDEAINSIATDANGNTFIAGSCFTTSMPLGTTTVPGLGMFVGKYNSAGVPLWGAGQSAGSSAASIGKAVAIDASGGVYVAGTINSAVSFDSSSITDCAASTTDVFLAKYNDATAGVIEVGREQQTIQLYPNPAVNEITVAGAQQLGAVVITTITGQVVHRKLYKAEKAQIAVSALPAGLYLVRVGDTQTLKFVKQ